MKCPKCGYLGFEHVERCRNCGYDFSLIQSPALPELPLRSEGQPLGPLEDLSLLNAAMVPAPSRGPAQTSRLPLFGTSALDDEPLITKPSPPRPPLAVRRATPELPRVRVAPRFPALDLALDSDVSEPAGAPVTPQWLATPVPPATSRDEEGSLDAALGARLVAVAIDLLVLAATDLVVVYLTMQICGIGASEWGLLPRWPLLAFLLVQNGAYLVVFTAGGQTLGKMAMGIKVVPHHSLASIDLVHALVRELAWLVLALPAGLGFLTVFSQGHRGLHDRFAGTRVVR
jgi:uncharacterized RDD family membrane protein YckC